MFVGDRMSHPVISLATDTPIHDALALFKAEHIRRAPVIKNGKLVGIVSQTDLMNASPSPVSSLSIWEMNYLLSKVTIGEIMTKKVITITENTPIEEAARIMADNKIGGVPVLRDKKVVGIITETDLFKIFLEFMGARDKGIRVTALVKNQRGQLAKITKAISNAGGDFVSIGQFAGEDPSTTLLTFKVAGLKKEQVKDAIGHIVQKIWDIR